ncbi:MAG TPA: LPXTG cell wall anchor domain-containing protein, partial [Candidatus Copromorpha excrementipullorum]|nr:LPXTG cell wall anchor domain-containing protein [Candidatus Copromorpha excrementipullorum]
GKVSVKYTSGNNTTYYVGTQAQINEIVKAAGAGDKIDVLQGNIALDIPTADVQITNSGTGEISVNGETVIAGETIMTKGQASTQPSTTTPADETTAASNDKAVATGDDFNMTALLAIMGVAAAAAAGTVVYGRRKRSN